MIHNVVGDVHNRDHVVITKQSLGLRLCRLPCGYRLPQQIPTCDGQHNGPASTVRSIPNFLCPAFRKYHLQVSR